MDLTGKLGDGVDRIDRCLEQFAREIEPVARNQRGGIDLEAGEHHAAVARARAPAERVRLEHRNLDATARQRLAEQYLDLGVDAAQVG